MEFGLFVEPQMGGSYKRLVEIAKWAEATGLDAFARSDHYLHMEHSADATDALVSLGGVATATRSIRLLTLVSPISFRHPAVMAKAATTLDDMSNGRFTLGVGTGWMQSEHDAFGMELPPMAERFDRLEESLRYIRAVFAGGGAVAGDHYSFALEDVGPLPSQGLKIVIGGSGPVKTPTLAGRYADEYNMFVAERHSVEQRMDVMRDAASKAGRDPEAILLSFAGPGFIYETEEEHAAVIATRAGRKDMSVDEYTKYLDDRAVPHGVGVNGGKAIETMASWGVGRYYVQNISPLDDISFDDLGRTFTSLRGG
jgi:alkanesulfonate monooxygenase SsuD/methylene tetrahydromethanopterin reductase-like flavin-dependent oxidoreductase (luciferase family)